MAPLCKFYQRGDCRNGANCRFEHPGANTGGNSYSSNRFNAFSSSSASSSDSNAYKLTKDIIKVDLADERPTWILSCYGPGRSAPEQLFGGYPREQSLEEVMLYIRGSANQQQAIAEVTELYNQAQHQIQTILGNLDGAVNFVVGAENNHPNRNDICKQNTNESAPTGIFAVKTGYAENPLASNVATNQNPFSTTSQSNPFGGGTPAFGQPSTLGQTPSAFQSAQPSQFGRPSQMGAGAPAFGQPTQIGGAAPAFGQPTQMGAGASAFGQPSRMGAAAPAFGQASTMGQRPSPFAAASSAAPSGFSQVGQPAFGRTSTMGQAPNPFGAPTASTGNVFGQQQGSAPPAANPFSQPSQAAAPNPFGSSMDTSGPSPATNNPFGQPSNPSSGQGMQAPNPFGAPIASMATGAPNPFGQALANSQAASAPQAKTGPYAPGSTKQHPPVDSYIQKTMNGQIMAFKNQPIVYKWKVNDRYQDQPPPNPTVDQRVAGVRMPDGTWYKVLFPNGPPNYNKDTEPDAAQYNANVQAAYAQMAASGRFQGGIPEVAPMREDCIWSF